MQKFINDHESQSSLLITGKRAFKFRNLSLNTLGAFRMLNRKVLGLLQLRLIDTVDGFPAKQWYGLNAQ